MKHSKLTANGRARVHVGPTKTQLATLCAGWKTKTTKELAIELHVHERTIARWAEKLRLKPHARGPAPGTGLNREYWVLRWRDDGTYATRGRGSNDLRRAVKFKQRARAVALRDSFLDRRFVLVHIRPKTGRTK